jgi:hypothetical protein
MKANFSALRILPVLIALSALASVGAAQAAVVEGFESTSLTQGSNAIGDASIQGVYFTINPTQLTHQLLLTSINNAAGADPTPANPQNQSGFNAVANVTTPGGLADFFGVTANTIRNGTPVGQEGSGFKMSLGALNVGDVVSFDYDFLTKETGSHADFGFALLQNTTASTNNYQVFSQASAAGTPTTGAGNPFNLETGYHTFSFTITSAGNYSLGLGVADATDKTIASGALIDNISVTSAAVPEPSTIGLMIAGAVSLAAARRRFKKAQF